MTWFYVMSKLVVLSVVNLYTIFFLCLQENILVIQSGICIHLYLIKYHQHEQELDLGHLLSTIPCLYLFSLIFEPVLSNFLFILMLHKRKSLAEP